MSAQIPSITVTSIDTTSAEEPAKVCSLEADEDTRLLGSSEAEGEQAKRRMRWVLQHFRVLTSYAAGGSLRGVGIWEILRNGNRPSQHRPPAVGATRGPGRTSRISLENNLSNSSPAPRQESLSLSCSSSAN